MFDKHKNKFIELQESFRVNKMNQIVCFVSMFMILLVVLSINIAVIKIPLFLFLVILFSKILSFAKKSHKDYMKKSKQDAIDEINCFIDEVNSFRVNVEYFSPTEFYVSFFNCCIGIIEDFDGIDVAESELRKARNMYKKFKEYESNVKNNRFEYEYKQESKTVSIKDDSREALLFFGFNKIPDKKSLKMMYKQLPFKNHPDHGGDVELMKKTNHYYDVLLDYV